MSNSLPINPFTSVRPRGAEATSKAPRKTNHSKAPKSGNVHLLLDSNGRQTVPFVSPPHFRTGSVPPPPPNPVERAALVALNHARNDRSQPKSRKGSG